MDCELPVTFLIRWTSWSERCGTAGGVCCPPGCGLCEM